MAAASAASGADATNAGAGSVWNANSWHWEEKNHTKFMEDCVRRAMMGTVVETHEAAAAITDVTELKGEASVNIRKGKKIFLFELSVRAKWEGSIKDGSTDESKARRDRMVRGTIAITELFQDDLDEDFPVEVKSDTSVVSAADRKVYDLMKGKGADAIREGIRHFYEQLKSADGGREAIEADKARRAEEAAKRDEAERTNAAEKARIQAEVRAREEARKVEEERKAAEAPTRIAPAAAPVAGTGSEWNAGSYHWEEKPAGQWARDRIKELIGGLEVEVPSGTLRVTGVDHVTGDASVTIRKGKKIAFFEFDIKADFEGELLDGSGDIVARADGSFHIPDVDADSVMDEDYEVRVTADPGSTGGERLVTEMRKGLGLKAIRATLSQVYKELQAR